MIKYVIGIHLLIQELRTVHPHVMQTWYADNADTGGRFDVLQDHMRDLLMREPLQGYLPDLTKSILVVSPWNFQQAEDHFQGMGVQVVTGSH